MGVQERSGRSCEPDGGQENVLKLDLASIYLAMFLFYLDLLGVLCRKQILL